MEFVEQVLLSALGIDSVTKGSVPYFLIKLLLILLCTFMLAAVVNLLFRRVEKRNAAKGRKNSGYLNLFRYVILVVVYVGAFLTIIEESPSLNSAISKILASGGVAAVVLSIACQEPLANLFSGIMIALSKPFQAGDVIRYVDNDISGTVEEISLRHTVIRTFENKRLIIPNSIMNSTAIENYNYSESKTCMFLDFRITYESSVPQAMDIIRDVILLHPKYYDNRKASEITAGAPAVRVLVTEFEESYIVVRAWVWADNLTDSMFMKSDILLGVRRRFADANIEFAYPHVTVVEKPSEA